MKRLVLVDTDVLIDFLRGEPEALELLKAHAGHACVSALSVAEVFAGARDENEAARLDDLFASFEVIPVTADLARTAGLLRGRFGKSSGLGIADALIAATAEAENADLATMNVRHFPMFAELEPAYLRR
jgi:predicted nucleic acid-binding protein